MEVARWNAVVSLAATFECDLVNVAFHVIKAFLKRHLIARFFLALAHFKAAAIFELNRLLVSGKIAVSYVMWAT